MKYSLFASDGSAVCSSCALLIWFYVWPFISIDSGWLSWKHAWHRPVMIGDKHQRDITVMSLHAGFVFTLNTNITSTRHKACTSDWSRLKCPVRTPYWHSIPKLLLMNAILNSKIDWHQETIFDSPPFFVTHFLIFRKATQYFLWVKSEKKQVRRIFATVDVAWQGSSLRRLL